MILDLNYSIYSSFLPLSEFVLVQCRIDYRVTVPSKDANNTGINLYRSGKSAILYSLMSLWYIEIFQSSWYVWISLYISAVLLFSLSQFGGGEGVVEDIAASTPSSHTHTTGYPHLSQRTKDTQQALIDHCMAKVVLAACLTLIAQRSLQQLCRT